MIEGTLVISCDRCEKRKLYLKQVGVDIDSELEKSSWVKLGSNKHLCSQCRNRPDTIELKLECSDYRVNLTTQAVVESLEKLLDNLRHSLTSLHSRQALFIDKKDPDITIKVLINKDKWVKQ